jgi:hypothetical protein
METKKESEQKFREVEVPEVAMSEVAGIIAESGIHASVFGQGEQEKSVAIGFYYNTSQRESMMEILEVIEDSENGEE